MARRDRCYREKKKTEKREKRLVRKREGDGRRGLLKEINDRAHVESNDK